MYTATLITIGDELVIGQTIDTNSAWIAQQLNGLGMNIRRRVAISDNREDILTTLTDELALADVLIITGGLGPTSDDITKPVLAEFFGCGIYTHEPTLEHVKRMFEQRKRPLLEVNLRQADVPECCEVLPNEMGTAPGMWFEKDGKIVISLPGVPYEMIHIMEQVALPKLRACRSQGAVQHLTILTAGEGESFVAHRIQDLEAALPPHIRLAYLPSPGMVRLRLSGKHEDAQTLDKEIRMRGEELANRLEDLVVAMEDLPLEHLIGKALTAQNKTLGLAESCTGGYIAHRITQIMGSAGYFQGSIVCYQEFVKEQQLGVKRKTIDQYCVVSEEVAREMAEGARKALKADIGFGVTGLLSGGGTDRVEVGTVCMAISEGVHTSSRTFRFHLDRVRNKELAVQHSLLIILKHLQRHTGS